MISNDVDIETISKLVEIIYLDHVLFRNLKSSEITPSLRKTIGWITRQTARASLEDKFDQGIPSFPIISLFLGYFVFQILVKVKKS